MSVSHPVRGGLLILLSCLFYACTSVFVKLLPSGTDPFFISFIRFIIGAALALIALRAARLPLRVADPFSLVMRGASRSDSSLCRRRVSGVRRSWAMWSVA